jgi:ubiquinone/menaquinone biosynthesis C-methylase UbiE
MPTWRGPQPHAACAQCGAAVRVDEVAIDVVPDRPTPASWGARAMESEWLARSYESWWRPIAFALSTRFGAPSAEEEARLVLGLLAGREGPWLDLSCGPGTLTRALVNAAGLRTVVGVDSSRAMLARARIAAPGAVLVRADASSLPLYDGVFGAVANLAALDLYADPSSVVAEAARVLARGGRWVCSTFVANRAAPTRPPFGSVSGRVIPTVEELEAWARRAGLARFDKLAFRRYVIAWADKE